MTCADDRAGVCVLEAAAGLVVQPRFRAMFADFGSTLPLLTQFALRPWVLVVAGSIPMALVLGGVLGKRSEPEMVAICVIAVGAALGLVIAFAAAMYLPIIGIAGAIK